MLKVCKDDRIRQLGQRIAYFRGRLGWSQQRLADEVGISLSYISKIEAPNSARSYSLDVLFAIADALGVAVYELFAPSE